MNPVGLRCSAWSSAAAAAGVLLALAIGGCGKKEEAPPKPAPAARAAADASNAIAAYTRWRRVRTASPERNRAKWVFSRSQRNRAHDAEAWR